MRAARKTFDCSNAARYVTAYVDSDENIGACVSSRTRNWEPGVRVKKKTFERLQASDYRVHSHFDIISIMAS
ncbi:hypothetical protein PILCRDRAFT_814021 [Piloderma croceum F 1598]|uniref:Uncharacterized protein n=1 Tax=Piloderma croceum (strain F 1598) TaxID=765440 RepID=A0A0C3BNT2_PILCF|nr:hypothetical protein PILCRDRAFT_814021 [Piloderma croceum F 1598]